MPVVRYVAPMRGGLAALIFLIVPAVARAESPAEFCSDRPGLTTGTCTAAAGTFQLETSLAEWSHSAGEDELALGSSRLRFGIDDRTDFHLAIAPYIRTHESGPDGSTDHGAGDLSIAVKHVLTRRDMPIAVAVMPFVKVPTARQPIGNGEWEGGLLLPIGATLSGPWSLTLTPELDWNADGDGHGHHLRHALAATLGLSLGERWSASLDGMIAGERDDGSSSREAAAAASLAFLATPTLQLDVQADLGLARDTPDIKLTSGIAFRF